MLPDLLINSLISGLNDGYTSFWLSILSSVKPAQYSFMFSSSFPVPLLPFPTLASFFPVQNSGVRLFLFYFLKGMERPISLYPWHNKILRYRDRKLLLPQAPTRKSLCITASSCLNIHGHGSVYKSLKPSFLLQQEDVLLQNRLQKELNLEPFKGWMEGRLSEKDL